MDNDFTLGQMFFQEFYGIFTNQYTNALAATHTSTSVEIYVNTDSAYYSTYVGGSQSLDKGANPFEDEVGASLTWLWIVLGLLVVAIIIIIVVVMFKRQKGMDIPDDDPESLHSKLNAQI